MTSDESSRRPAAAVGSIDPQLLQLVSEATQGEYAILGELGRDGDRSYFLARELATGALVVLGMWEELDPEGTPQIAVSVFRQIDATMPAPGALCHACGGVVDRWERFCLSCGADLSGAAADDTVPGGSREALLAAVKAAAEDGYDVLGTIDRAEGGGVVYFAFEESTGRLVGLSLQQQDDPTTSELEYELVVTWCTPDAPAAAPTPAAPAAAMTVATGQLREKAAADRVPPAAAAAAPSGTPARIPNDGGAPRRTRAIAAGLAIAFVAAAVALVAALTGDPDPAPESTSAADSIIVIPDPDTVRAQDTTRQQTLAPDTTSPPQPARVVLVGIPSASRVTVNGEVKGPSFLLPPGTHTIVVTARGYEPRRRRVTLSAGDSIDLVLTLRPDAPLYDSDSPEVAAAKVKALIENYAEAVRARDLNRLRQLYPGISRGEQDGWSTYFEAVTTDLQVVSRVTKVTPEGNTAEAEFTLMISYGEGGSARRIDYSATAGRAPDGAWRFFSIRAPYRS